MSPPAKKYLLHRCFSLIFTVLLVSSVGTAQQGNDPSIRPLIESIQTQQKEFSSNLLGYTYTLKRTMQELNDKGEVKKERVQVFQAFPVVEGAPVMMLLSENGEDLSPSRQAKEKARANSEWRKRKKESEKNKGLAEPPQTPYFLGGSEFSRLGIERYNNRDVVVLKFGPRQDFKPTKKSEEFVSRLEGKLWIDIAEKAVVKFEGKLVERYKPGLVGHITPLEPGTSLLIESSPISNGLWAVTRIEFGPGLISSLFSKTVRYHHKQKDEMSDYKPFNKDADDLFAN